MNPIDRTGTFLGKIGASGIDTTKKGYPQWVAQLTATKRYVEDAEEMAHFQITEPAYVDWAGDTIMAFMVLFNSADQFNDDTSMLNYGQLQAATKWDGASFDALGDASLLGKEILFRVSEKKDYTKADGTVVNQSGKFEVSWIDAADASPTRTMKSLDAAGIKGLNAKLQIKKKVVAAAAPARPVAAPKPTAPAPVTTPAVATPAEPAKPKGPPKKKAAVVAAPVVDAAAPAKTERTAQTTQLDAWNYVIENKGSNSDDTIAEAWQAACQEVGENKNESDFTPTDWAKVRDIVIRDCSL